MPPLHETLLRVMPQTTYTRALTPAQATALREELLDLGYDFVERPYTLYSASKGKVNLSVYEKGPKIVVQGKETEEFVRYLLEPKILGQAELGQEESLHPDMFEPHFGIDESGKGDYFGPLVIAGVYTHREIARAFLEGGIQDSKSIKSEQSIRKLAHLIRSTSGVAYDVITIAPPRYNELYESFGNVNRLLAWGHAKAIENLHRKRPDCPRALSDQFAKPQVLEKALAACELDLRLEQRTKAESDLAVGAASILAREAFLIWLEDKGKELGLTLPRGASLSVQSLVADLSEKHGPDFLRQIGKTHFKVTASKSDRTHSS
ncbi:MAG: ribonuclease HIII [Verrucomicrobiota bacterium]